MQHNSIPLTQIGDYNKPDFLFLCNERVVIMCAYIHVHENEIKGMIRHNYQHWVPLKNAENSICIESMILFVCQVCVFSIVFIAL